MGPREARPAPEFPAGILRLEERMKTIAAAFMTLAFTVCIGGWCFAFETDFDDLNRFDRNLPGWKLGRGITNILFAPNELFAHTTNNAIKGAYAGAYDGGLHGYMAGSLNGFLAGIGPGMIGMVRRITTGALEIATFWKPEYGPTLDPQWGTRCLAGGPLDLFDPDPYWYNGPWR